jgi:putative membrane protein
MIVLGFVVAAVAGLIHVWFFVLESLWFMRPSVHARFGIRTAEEAGVARPWAYNQGFYNLFLAVGALGGGALALVAGGPTGAVALFAAGRAIAFFACGSIGAAGLVLLATDRHLARAAALQIVPGLVASILLLVG